MTDFISGAPVVLGSPFRINQAIQMVIPSTQGPPGADGGTDNTLLNNHIASSSPHTVYDDMLDLALIYENGKI